MILQEKINANDYAKFVHAFDIKGNKVGLWEPFDDGCDKMVKARTK